jgi:hypothetical protein
MCIDPFTALAFAGAAVSAAGSAMGIAQQAAAQRQQARMHDRQAIMERQAGAFRAARETERVQGILGQGVAAAGANGVRIQGTTGRAIQDIATGGALDVAATRWNAASAADNEMILSDQANVNAKNTMMAMPFAIATPFINAAASSVSMTPSGGAGPVGTSIGAGNPFVPIPRPRPY